MFLTVSLSLVFLTKDSLTLFYLVALYLSEIPSHTQPYCTHFLRYHQSLPSLTFLIKHTSHTSDLLISVTSGQSYKHFTLESYWLENCLYYDSRGVLLGYFWNIFDTKVAKLVDNFCGSFLKQHLRVLPLFSVTRLGDLLLFGQLFKGGDNNYIAQIDHLFRQFL